jgi:hypothetical protein
MTRLVGFLASALIAFSAPAFGKGKGGMPRPNYGGGHHTASHGGAYPGGSGSSHKGGHYKNPTTGDQYGKHKGSSQR